MKQFDMTIPTMQLMEHIEATFNKSSTTTRYSSIKDLLNNYCLIMQYVV